MRFFKADERKSVVGLTGKKVKNRNLEKKKSRRKK